MKERWGYTANIISEYSLYGLIFFIPFTKAAVEVFAGLAFLGFVIKKIVKPDFSFIKSSTHFFLMLFVFFSALSMFNSGPYLMKSFWALSLKWLKYIGIFLIVQDTLVSQPRIKRAVTILFFSAALVGIDALTQRLIGIDFLRQKSLIRIDPGGFYAVTASFNHYNSLGAYLIIVLSLVVSLLISKEPKVPIYRWLLLVMGILLLVCILLTFSRGSWLGFISALLLILILSRKFKFLVLLISIFIILLIFLPQLRQRCAFTFQPSGDAARFAIWRTAFKMIGENPFLGKGLGTFMDYFGKEIHNLSPQYAHNCFLQIWAETGIFSLLSFLIFLTLLLGRGIKAFMINQNSLVLGLLCGISGFLVHSFFDTHLYSLQLAFLFWSMAGLLVAAANLELVARKIKSGTF